MEGRIRIRRFAAAVATASVFLIAFLATPATAATDCDHVWASRSMTVTINDPRAAPVLDVVADKLRVDGVVCGGANRWSVDTVFVNDASGGNTTVAIDLAKGPFRPGSTDEPGSSDEIEFEIDLGSGSGDVLRVLGTRSGDTLVLGDGGINLNPPETDGTDADVALSGVERVVFHGRGGNDVLRADGGEGTGGPSTLATTLNGAKGADRLIGGEGRDRFVGGPGFDLVDYSARTEPVTATIGSLANDGRTGERDSVTGTVEWVLGGSGNDLIEGDGDAELLEGGPGDDIIRGWGGDDELRGGPGDDRLEGIANDDLLHGGPGNDVEDGGGYNDVFQQTEQSVYTSYHLRAIPDTGRIGAKLTVSDGPSTIYDANVRIDIDHPRTEDLVINLIAPSGKVVRLATNRGNGTPMTGSMFDSEAVRIVANSTSQGLPLAGRHHPESSMENVRTLDANGTWTLDVTDSVGGSVGRINMFQLEITYLTHEHSGSDVIVGGPGGRDLVDYVGRAGNVTATLLSDGAVDGDASSGEADQIDLDVEDLYGGNGNDHLTGNDGVNDLRGTGGTDTMVGLEGNDRLRGNAGADTLLGGDGDDDLFAAHGGETYDGGAGWDTLNYNPLGTAVSIDLSAGTTTAPDGNDTMSDIERVIGTRFDDTITGDDGPNELIGNPGNDTLHGLDGDDTVNGGPGTDSGDGGDGSDWCPNVETRSSCEST